MTRDDIMALAEKAGIVVTGEAVLKLCALVAAAEREKCAKVVEVSAEAACDVYGERHLLWCAKAIRARGQE